jgi:hypothetical protein
MEVLAQARAASRFLKSDIPRTPLSMSHPPPIPTTTFPLPPLDADGKTLFVGCIVKVLSVESCANGLPVEDQDRLRACVGKFRKVVAFDQSGFAWLCFSSSEKPSADFCVFPTELALA